MIKKYLVTVLFFIATTASFATHADAQTTSATTSIEETIARAQANAIKQLEERAPREQPAIQNNQNTSNTTPAPNKASPTPAQSSTSATQQQNPWVKPNPWAEQAKQNPWANQSLPPAPNTNAAPPAYQRTLPPPPNIFVTPNATNSASPTTSPSTQK